MSDSNGAIETPPTPEHSALLAIAEYTRGIRFARLPRAVVDRARIQLLEGISWIAMGASRDQGRRVIATVEEAGADGPCSVLGTVRTTTLDRAAFANAALTQVYDCNDGRRLARSRGGTNHPGRCVIPVAIGLADLFRLPGDRLVESVVLGYEVAARVVDHGAPSRAYSYATAAMLAHATGLATPGIVQLLAHAHFSLPPSAPWPFELDLDFLHLGSTVRAAILAAELLPGGFNLPLEHCRLTLGSAFPSPTEPEVADFELLSVYIKPYPCCRALHGAIDLSLRLRDERPFEPTDLEDVEIRVGNRKPELFEAVHAETDYKRAQFSIPYAAAAALLDGQVTDASFTSESFARPAVAELQRRIRVVSDPKLDFVPHGIASHARPTTMSVRFVRGEQWTASVLAPLGSPLHPMSQARLLEKFHSWSRASLCERRRVALVERVMRIEVLEDAAGLLADDAP
jgi:2-methylcitrate dehydratase PrpD